MTILQDIIASIRALEKKKVEWPSANQIITQGCSQHHSPSVMTELQKMSQPGKCLNRKRRDDGVYGYRIRPGVGVDELENVSRSGRKPKEAFQIVSGVLAEVRETLRTHGTVKGIAVSTRRSEFVVRECCKSLVQRGEAQEVGHDQYELKAAGQKAIEAVSKAHAEAIKTPREIPTLPRPVARTVSLMDRPPLKSVELPPAVELSPPVVTVKESSPCPAAVAGPIARNGAVVLAPESVAGVALSPVPVLGETPVEDRFHAEKTLVWLKDRRDQLSRDQINVERAITSLEQLLEATA